MTPPERTPKAGSARRVAAPGSAGWTLERAEAQLRSLELFGMRFGLDRMRRMMTALSSPERAYDSIQVLGTNGKSSTTRMIAAILGRHGLSTGTYTSPHLVSYRERLEIDGQQIGEEDFARAVQRASLAAERVNRTLGGEDHVTQFELLTAAAFAELAARKVDVAVVEAGLGGRYDATSVLDARVTVLTNVALEHTRWLGPTIADIAEEKLAVVAPGATLVLGAGLAEEARAVAERVAAERGARIVWAGAGAGEGEGEGEIAPARAPGPFQRRNFALASTAARAYLDAAGVPVREEAEREAAASVEIQGRLQLIGSEPPTVLDGAHNPAAVEALVEALADALPQRPRALVLGVLEDKDAAGMLALLLPEVDAAWFTLPPSPRALPPAALESLARQLSFAESSCDSSPQRALASAREWAAERGGSVLATGSVYLIGELLAALRGGSSEDAVGAEGGSSA